jgi:hypothetical protein
MVLAIIIEFDFGFGLLYSKFTFVIKLKEMDFIVIVKKVVLE